SSGITGTSNTITVSPAAATHFGVAAPTPQTAGTAFSFTVTAQDQFNNTATGYAGTAHFTSTDGAATLPADSTLTSGTGTFSATNGTGTFSATLNTTGSRTITAADTVTFSITGTSNSINVVTNAAPVVTAGGTLNYTENQPATPIDNTITVTDSDSPTLASAT